MLHPETHLVTADNGPRPAGKPDECFYCKQKIGEQHKPDCVCRRKTVVVRFSIEYAIVVPENWDEESVEFSRNGSSWCQGNIIEELQKLDNGENKNNVCLCDIGNFEYVREATQADDNRAYLNEIKD